MVMAFLKGSPLFFGCKERFGSGNGMSGLLILLFGKLARQFRNLIDILLLCKHLFERHGSAKSNHQFRM